jgi:hypothetical protein
MRFRTCRRLRPAIAHADAPSSFAWFGGAWTIPKSGSASKPSVRYNILAPGTKSAASKRMNSGHRLAEKGVREAVVHIPLHDIARREGRHENLRGPS